MLFRCGARWLRWSANPVGATGSEAKQLAKRSGSEAVAPKGYAVFSPRIHGGTGAATQKLDNQGRILLLCGKVQKAPNPLEAGPLGKGS